MRKINNSVIRITALWALSEAALGGVLHAFKIPLTGLFINGSAVLFIALIGYYSEKKSTIITATIIVLIVKAGVSPHTPPAAYIAVSLQGIIGEILFRYKQFYKIAALIFGLITLTLSSLQKIFFLTLVYGLNLWESIDQFGSYITKQLPFLSEIEDLSLWIIGIYSGIHIITGFIVGIIAGKLPRWIEDNEEIFDQEFLMEVKIKVKKGKRKRKPFYKKTSSILIFFMAIMIIILSYVFPHFSESTGVKALIMVVRYIIIMSLWFYFIAPLVIKLYKNIFKKKRGKYSKEIDTTINMLPVLKSAVSYKWKKYGNLSFFKRVKAFIVSIFIFVLKADLSDLNGRGT